LGREAIQEIVGTLGRRVKVSDPEIAQRVKAHRKRAKKRALGCVLNVSKEAVAPGATASPPRDGGKSIRGRPRWLLPCGAITPPKLFVSLQ
jgi:hypothetical protein